MNQEIKLIDIVLCIDHNIMIPSLVTIQSILDNTKSKIRFNILLEQGLLDEYNILINKNNFKAIFNIVEFIPPKNLINILAKYKKHKLLKRKKLYYN